jgi:uncharacterized membrane protein (Fun14 family)
MEYVVGIVIISLFGICIYGIIDVIKQLKNMD